MWSKISKSDKRKATNWEQSLTWKSFDIRHHFNKEKWGCLMLHTYCYMLHVTSDSNFPTTFLRSFGKKYFFTCSFSILHNFAI